MLQYYLVEGQVLSAEKALETYGLPVGTYNTCLKNPEVVEALKERGVVFGRGSSDWAASSLTAIQLIVANTMLDLVDTRSQKKKLQDLDISTHVYDAWLRDPIFSAYLKERAENLLGDSSHEAHLALIDKVRMGDIKAIEYYNSMTGRYVKETTNSGSTADLKSIIIRIIEIVNDVVSNPQEVAEIGDRLMQLITAQTIAGALVDGSPVGRLPQPEIMPAPVLNDEMKELVEHGEGF